MRTPLLLLAFLAACSSSSTPRITVVMQTIGPAGGTVMSADGRLTLEIPAGALAAPTDITIESAAAGPTFDGVDIVGAYELGPDGLQFAEDVRVTLTFDDPEDLVTELVLLYVQSGGETDVAANMEHTEGAVTGTIRHFSRMIGAQAGVIVEITGVPESMPSNGIFDSSATVRTTGNSIVTGSATLFATAEGALQRSGEANRPVGTLLDTMAQSFTVQHGPFTCTRIGTSTVVFSLTFPDPQFSFTSRREPATIVLTREIEHERVISLEPVFVPTCPGSEDVGRIEGDDAQRLGASGWLIYANATDEGLALVDAVLGEMIGKIEMGDLSRTCCTPGFVFGAGPSGFHVSRITEQGAAPPVTLGTGNYTDLYRKMGDSDAVAAVNFTENHVRAVRRNAAGTAYELAEILCDGDDLPNASGNIVSSVWRAGGGLLIVTVGSPGQLWFKPNGGTPALIGELGTEPRTVRSAGGIVAAASFGGAVAFGAMSYFRIEGDTITPLGGHIAGGPVGIELCVTPGGSVRVAMALSRNNEWGIAEVDFQGVASFDTFDLAEGCSATAHAIWGDAEFRTIVYSCSDGIVIEPLGD